MILFMTGSLIGESASQDNLNDTLRAGYDVNLNVTESLPTPLPLRDGAQARNYVAYIPVPISDDEDEDDEYYDDDEENDEDEDDYYEVGNSYTIL